MNLWTPDFFDDAELIAEIRQYAAARKEVMNDRIGKVQGEGRLIEFTNNPEDRKQLNADLREMMAEARRRGLSIGGTGGGAIAVEIGL